jgi:hypothetical protein
LIAVLSEAAAARGRRFGYAVIEGWIESGLLDPADREGNEGVRPRYSYGQRHVERGQAILALRAEGFADHDAIAIRLFLDGANMPAATLERAVRSEYGAGVRRLNSPVRSTAATTLEDLTPKRAAKFLRQLGEVDERLKDAGLALPPDVVIRIYRLARRSFRPRSAAPSRRGALESFDLNGLMRLALPVAIDSAGGLLRQEEEQPGQPIARIESAIVGATDADWRAARRLFGTVELLLHDFGSLMRVFDVTDDQAEALDLAGRIASLSIKAPFWSAAGLAMSLIAARASIGSEMDFNKLSKVFRLAARHPKAIGMRVRPILLNAQ